MKDRLAHNLQATKQRIDAASERYQRAPASVQLLAVTKTQPVEVVREAYLLGQTQFGENYLQEAIAKIGALSDCNISWHFIGSIQSNKTKIIAEHFDWVHSVDRLKIAQRLNEARAPMPTPLNICLQINISEEESKSGISLEDLPELVAQIKQLPHLRLRGLMTLPAPSSDFASQRASFAPIKHAFDALNAQGAGLDTLSMGMSDDLEAAIAEGSTMVRIGSAIFGARPTKGAG